MTRTQEILFGLLLILVSGSTTCFLLGIPLLEMVKVVMLMLVALTSFFVFVVGAMLILPE